MARSRVVARGRSGAIHNKEWTAACIDGTSLDIAIGTVAVFVMFTADEAETLLRTRGNLLTILDASAVNENATIAVGIGVVSARAAAAGAASVPRPATEGAYPWIWYGWFNVTSGIEAAVIPQYLGERLMIDSKAMRKIKETEVVVLVFEVCESTDQGGQVSLFGGLRVLTGD